MHEGYVHDIGFLDDAESWELLLKTTFVGHIPKHVDAQLENIGRAILKKCGGLPLAITVAGGLLMEKGGSVSGWEKVLKEMTSLFDRSGESESSSVLAILELSYFKLPTKLKACFLCLGFFKEDAAIGTKRLVRIWVAQGIIPQEEAKTMEEVAEGYLDELINRNLVQIKDLSDNDDFKTCHVHDLVRDLSIKKAKEEINFEILKKERNIHQSSSHKPRHRAMYCSGGESFISSNTDENKRIRSFFVHGIVEDFAPPSYWKSFELLKILDFEDCELKKVPDTIGELIGLRYLSLRCTLAGTLELPSSLGNLINLEVLDLGGFIVTTPNVVWKLRSLRHLLVFELVCIGKSLKISTLRNIETLESFTLTDSNVKEITELTNLRKLGIYIDTDEMKVVFRSLSKLQNLVRLSIRQRSYERPINTDGLSSLHCVTKLELGGRITSVGNFPPNLSHLTLSDTRLEEDPMPILKKLPHLQLLKLYFNVYTGEVMVISHDGFSNLKTLGLYFMNELRDIEIEKGALPELQILEIEYCRNLRESFAEEVRQILPNLQKLKM